MHEGPGVYGSYTIGNTTCHLGPGAYVFTGPLTFQSNNSHLTSDGQPVTLFFAKSDPSKPCGTGSGKAPCGSIDIKNGDIYDMVAPTTPPVAGWPTGFVIVYDRANNEPLGLQGNGDSTPDVTGTVYAVKSTIAFNGNACFQLSQGPVIVGGITGTGNQGCVKLINTVNAGAGTPEGLRLSK